MLGNDAFFVAFAPTEKFVETKSSKQFGWIREYTEQIRFDKEVKDKFKENYYTRMYVQGCLLNTFEVRSHIRSQPHELP